MSPLNPDDPILMRVVATSNDELERFTLDRQRRLFAAFDRERDALLTKIARLGDTSDTFSARQLRVALSALDDARKRLAVDLNRELGASWREAGGMAGAQALNELSTLEGAYGSTSTARGIAALAGVVPNRAIARVDELSALELEALGGELDAATRLTLQRGLVQGLSSRELVPVLAQQLGDAWTGKRWQLERTLRQGLNAVINQGHNETYIEARDELLPELQRAGHEFLMTPAMASRATRKAGFRRVNHPFSKHLEGAVTPLDKPWVIASPEYPVMFWARTSGGYTGMHYPAHMWERGREVPWHPAWEGNRASAAARATRRDELLAQAQPPVPEVQPPEPAPAPAPVAPPRATRPPIVRPSIDRIRPVARTGSVAPGPSNITPPTGRRGNVIPRRVAPAPPTPIPAPVNVRDMTGPEVRRHISSLIDPDLKTEKKLFDAIASTENDIKSLTARIDAIKLEDDIQQFIDETGYDGDSFMLLFEPNDQYLAWKAKRPISQDLKSRNELKATIDNKVTELAKMSTQHEQVRTRINNNLLGVLQRQQLNETINVKYDGAVDKDSALVSDAVNFIKKSFSGDMSHIDVKIMQLKNVRAGYDPDNRHVFIDQNNFDLKPSVMVHELAHWIEFNKPAYHKRILQFFRKRTDGEMLYDMYHLDRDAGYKVGQEFVHKDEFFNPYCGKVYPTKQGRHKTKVWDTSVDFPTEILSMGMEKLFDDPFYLINNDTDYFDLLWDIMRDKP
jgi:hypothetical protein